MSDQKGNQPVPVDDYLALGNTVFPSKVSAIWFIRKHRPVLAERGALIKVNGRRLVIPDAFDAAVRDIGRENALRDRQPHAREAK